MSISFALVNGVYPGDGDLGLALTTAQKNIFSADEISGVTPIDATIIDSVTGVVHTITLVTGLNIHHPWHPELWLLADANYPDEFFPFTLNPLSLFKTHITHITTESKNFDFPTHRTQLQANNFSFPLVRVQTQSNEFAFPIVRQQYNTASYSFSFPIVRQQNYGSVVVDIHTPELPTYGAY